MLDILSAILMLSGAFVMFLAGLGILRMPDLFIRISASTKGATLGAALLLLAVGIRFHSLDLLVKVIAIILFIAATSPISAHMIGRIAFIIGAPLWRCSIIDEFQEHHGPASGRAAPRAELYPDCATAGAGKRRDSNRKP